MSTPLHSRSELGLRAPRSVTRLTTAVHLTAHYAGPSPWRGTIGPHSRCATIWRAWQAFHMDTRGWSDIAYSSGVCPHGHRFEGRGPGVRTAANGTNTGNRLSLATCYIAGAGDPLTTDAKHAFLDEAARFGVPLNRVHRDWKSTACPGDPLTEWVRSGAKRPGVVPTPKPAPAPGPEEDDDVKYYQSDRKHGGGGEVYAITGHYYERLTDEQWALRRQEPGVKLEVVHPLRIVQMMQSRHPFMEPYLRTPKSKGGNGEVYTFTGETYRHLSPEQFKIRVEEAGGVLFVKDVYPLKVAQLQLTRTKVGNP